MSGGIIVSLIAPHPPRIAFEERAPAFQREMIAGSRALGEVLRALKPDLVVVKSTHWVTSFNWYATCQDPHHGHCVADEAPDLISGLPYHRRGDPAFARALVAKVAGAGLPCFPNESPYFEWDYASLVPLLHLDPAAVLPVVLIPTCLSADFEECLAVGRLVHDTAKAAGKRVAMLASSALSHKIVRGPEKWPSDEHRALDARLLAILQAGAVGEAIDWLPDYTKGAVAEMGGRVLTVMLGTLDALAREGKQLAGVQYGPYAQSSGSGNANLAILPAI